MRTLSLTFTAGQRIQVETIGNYVLLLETQGGVDIDFMQNQAVVQSAVNMEYGFYSKPMDGFTALGFISAIAQTIKICVGLGDGGYSRTSGTAAQGSFTQTQVTLSNVNQVLKVANSSRHYLLIQNNDSAQVLRVKLDGNAATATEGIRIMAGGSLELSGFQCTNAVNAIFEAASVATGNVEIVEG